MKIINEPLNDLLVLVPDVFSDERGFFLESFNQKKFNSLIGKEITFVQDNHSCSTKGVMRGLHFQRAPYAQGKLVRVIHGEVFDVALDIRKDSPSFGKWYGETLSAENKKMMWIPEGFAHGFFVTSDTAEFLYKTTNYWSKDHEGSIDCYDKTLNISWPDISPLIRSQKDSTAKSFLEADII